MDKDGALEQIFDDLIFHETLNIIFDIHRAAKKGYLFYLNEPIKNHLICNEAGKDVFGNPLNKIKKYTEDIECPSCKRLISANRFAPHLDKCLGKGRSSSRIASQKITASTIESHYSYQKGDDLVDGDWSGSQKEKKKVKRSKVKRSETNRSKKTKLS